MFLFNPPVAIASEIFTTMPGEFRKTGIRSAWGYANKQGHPVDCFIEGPAFDSDGNLYIVDIPHGRIFRISPRGEWVLAAEYDGQPNGLKLSTAE